eukprot:2285541-Rhodomonas_salina.2
MTGQRTVLGEEGMPASQLEEFHYANQGYSQQRTMLSGDQNGPGEECEHHYNCRSEFVRAETSASYPMLSSAARTHSINGKRGAP